VPCAAQMLLETVTHLFLHPPALHSLPWGTQPRLAACRTNSGVVFDNRIRMVPTAACKMYRQASIMSVATGSTFQGATHPDAPGRGSAPAGTWGRPASSRQSASSTAQHHCTASCHCRCCHSYRTRCWCRSAAMPDRRDTADTTAAYMPSLAPRFGLTSSSHSWPPWPMPGRRGARQCCRRRHSSLYFLLQPVESSIGAAVRHLMAEAWSGEVTKRAVAGGR
jgi:hypothetical protein